MTTASDLPVTDTAQDVKDGDTAPGAKPTAQDSGESKTHDYDSLPDWAQKEIKRLNSEARERRLQVRDQENAAKTQREQSLAEQEQWKVLADERLTEISKLKSRAEQFDELSVLFDKQFSDEVKEWPSELLEMAPAQEAPLTQRLTWLEKARPMAKKLMASAPSDTGAPRQPVGGNRRGPEPSSQSLRTQSPSLADVGPLVDAKKKF